MAKKPMTKERLKAARKVAKSMRKAGLKPRGSYSSGTSVGRIHSYGSGSVNRFSRSPRTSVTVTRHGFETRSSRGGIGSWVKDKTLSSARKTLRRAKSGQDTGILGQHGPFIKAWN